MFELSVIANNMIKLVSSSAIEEIIWRSGYFDEVEDISRQINAENTMVFDVFVNLHQICDIFQTDVRLRNAQMDKEEPEVIPNDVEKQIETYFDFVLEDICVLIREELGIQMVTADYKSSYSGEGAFGLIYIYFGNQYLH
ncbi:MAG: hypothetical protein ACOYVK_17930 [Bacillota bacterium]